MAGLVRPRLFSIRRITDTAQRVAHIFNPRRLPDHGGFTSAEKWGKNSEFGVEMPTKMKTAEESRHRSDD
jgi:hypothetical protein